MPLLHAPTREQVPCLPQEEPRSIAPHGTYRGSTPPFLSAKETSNRGMFEISKVAEASRMPPPGPHQAGGAPSSSRFLRFCHHQSAATMEMPVTSVTTPGMKHRRVATAKKNHSGIVVRRTR